MMNFKISSQFKIFFLFLLFPLFAFAQTVTGVTSIKANGTYKQGEVIPISITFSEVVNVTGTPQITLETGGTDAVVNYTSGTGTNTLTFNYTVLAGHTSSDLDYTSTSSLGLPVIVPPALGTPVYKDTSGSAIGVSVVGSFNKVGSYPWSLLIVASTK